MDREEFYFRQLVTEDDINTAFTDAENADHNLAADNGIFQKVDGSNAPLSMPAGTDFNALLGGIVSGLTVTLGGSGTTAVIAPGVAYDSAGNRICVPSTLNVLLTTTGTTSIGMGGTPGGIGSISTVPAGGQFTWVLLQIFFNRNLSDPREDGNDMTVYYSSTESFQFKVKVSASSASPAIPAGDPGCIILGAFYMNATPDITSENFTTRGDWLRTYAVYTAGTLPVEQFEDGTTSDPAFIAGNVRQAILKLRNTIGLSTTNYTNHINQSAPQDRHAAKNIDFDATSGIAWADGTTPALGSNLGGGVDTDGVQWAINTLISTIAGSTTGFGGTKYLGGASITGSPVTLAAGSIRSQLSSILTGLNNHLNATSGAHAATAISVTAGTVFTGTDVGTQLGQIDSYINGRVTTAVSISGSNATPIWVYKNAVGYSGFGIDHMAFPGGRLLEIRENWLEAYGTQTTGTGTNWFNNWNYGIIGTGTGYVATSGPVTSGVTNFPTGPQLKMLARGTAASSASVLEMNIPIIGLATMAFVIDFDFSINGGTPQTTTDYGIGIGDGSLISSAGTLGLTHTGSNPNGAYFLWSTGLGSNTIRTRTQVGASASLTTTTVAMVPNSPHRGRIEIIPVAFSDDGNNHVIYYIDGVQVAEDNYDMTTTSPYPFIRTSAQAGTTETVYLTVGPMRMISRLTTGNVFI
jgi:hypothetical protein